MSTPRITDAVSMFVDEARAQGGRRPLIGVSAGYQELEAGAWAGHEAVVLTRAYLDQIRAAGARAIVLTPGDEWSVEEIADLDGVVLTGGTDLAPELYGKAALATDFAPAPERDDFETALFAAAAEAGVPVLGICRGAQIINVACGGTLIQHLPDSEFGQRYPEAASAPVAVDVTIEADSDLALSLGTGARVTAYHHQAIDALGSGLRAVATHESGVIHAIESDSPDLGSVVAVQFHPEVSEGAAPLFQDFVARAYSTKAAMSACAGAAEFSSQRDTSRA